MTAVDHIRTELAEHEKTIERGLKTFVEVGTALMDIRDARLYRDDYATFEEYCQQRWGWGRNYVNKQISAAEVVRSLGTDVPTPARESQARELSGLEPEQAAEVMSKVAETGEKVTAAKIREVREQVAPRPVAKVTETTKTETYVDTDTGEVIDPEAPQAEALQVMQAIREFPDLDYYRDDGRRVIALAQNLRAFSDVERPGRIENLRKAIAADKRRAEQPPQPNEPDYYALAEAIFLAVNEAAKAAARNGGAETMQQAIDEADQITRKIWSAQFADTALLCQELADISAPGITTKLRSVK